MPSTPPAWQTVATELVASRGDALQRYAYLLCGSRDDAADLVQDGLVRTFSRLRDDFTVAAAEGYVRRAILSAYIDGGRRASRWRSILHLTARTDTGDSPTAAADTRLDLHTELSRLTRRERACVVLRYYEDLPVDDIADRLGLSPGTVKRYLSDGLHKLSASLTRVPESPAGSAVPTAGPLGPASLTATGPSGRSSPAPTGSGPTRPAPTGSAPTPSSPASAGPN